MSRSIIIPFHRYSLKGGEYHKVLFDFFLENLKKWRFEFDKLYLIDSDWEFTNTDIERLKFIKLDSEIIKDTSGDRYFDIYKKLVKQIPEDYVLFMDNDMVVYQPKKINDIFTLLMGEEGYDVVSIFDTIGTLTDKINKKWNQMHGKSKFCPYLFGAKTSLLRSVDCEWGPVKYPSGTYINELKYETVEGDWVETLGELTYKLLSHHINVYEMWEDKSSLYFDGTKNCGESMGKNLGYYHIRAGFVPIYLLTHKNLLNRGTYIDYLDKQPKNEYLRQMMWFWYMMDETKNLVKFEEDVVDFLGDVGVDLPEWLEYYSKFREFHGLNA